MKIILSALALSLSFVLGCQCTEKNEPAMDQEEVAVPAEEQEDFENADEGTPEAGDEQTTGEEEMDQGTEDSEAGHE